MHVLVVSRCSHCVFCADTFKLTDKNMETPVPFVLTGEDGTGLVIDPQAKAALSKIDKPLVVVSVVGMYR